MKQTNASAGKSDVATETFDTGKKADTSKDATEAKLVGGGLLATGNSRSLAATALGTLRSRRGANEVSVAAAVNYGRAAKPGEEMATTVENYQGKIRYDRFVSKDLALFLALSGRKDRFQGLTLRLNLDPGVAYYFIDEEKQQFWGELGYDLQFDVRRNSAIAAAAAQGQALEKSDVRHSGRLFVGYKESFNEHVGFNTGLEYLQGLGDTAYWRLNWDVGLTAALASRFSLATTFSLRFDNHPLPGVKELDTLSAVNLVYQLL
ncbi:MAG: DUF481 domain-containing protein [Myxococcota bacterium]